MDRFQGALVLVTGAGSGIGAACATRLAAEGATVVLADRDGEAIDRVAGELVAAGGAAHAVRCDQTSADDVQALYDEIERLGRLDVCVANAGWGQVDPFLDISLEVWQRHYDINVTGTFLVCQHAARAMAADGGGGSIVVTSSSSTLVPAALFGAYSSSKAALNNLVAVMAYELGAHDIRVNAVLPGVTETPLTETLLASGGRPLLERGLPLARPATPDDIAAVVSFLAGPDAAYVTGASLMIDGAGSAHANGWFATDFRTRGETKWRLRHKFSAPA